MGASAARRIVAALGLCLIAAAVSGLLLLQHHGEPSAVAAVNEACGAGPRSGCEDVARSSWSSLAGLPVAAYGLLFYLSLALALALALLAAAEAREALAGLALAGLVLGLLVDLFLLGVQVVAIRSYCWFCILTYVLGALAVAALFPARRALRAAPSAVARPDGRVAFAAWALGTSAVAAAVLTANASLGYRAAQRQANLLGRPLAATAPRSTATPSPSASAPSIAAPAAATPEAPSGPQDAKHWRERAQKLQETLDDPRKLEAYFSEKAQRQFETEPVVSIDLDNAPARGPANAPVRVVEYSDFLCPFCRNLGLALTQFIPQAGGRVVVYFKNYPLDAACNPKLKQSTHPGSCNLALGAICAQRQGKFDAYHDRVFSLELRNPQPSDVVRIAGEAGLNAAAMQGCLDDPKTKETLASQIAEANRLGVSATPTVYLEGKKLPRINDFIAVVDKEARKKGFPPLPQ